MSKLTVAGNFSRYASSYDRNASVQIEAAAMLARILPKDGVKKILEIGCGTGNYTVTLKNIFSDADIKAIDISGPMIRAARQKLKESRIDFEVGDIEEIALGGAYDLITSNAVFHWLSGLPGMIKKAKGALKDGGALIFSTFGPKTFLELKASLDFAVGRNASIAPDMFPEKAELSRALQEHFKTVKITERLIRESHPSLRDLLNKIKYSGTRGKGSDARQVWSRALLEKIEDEYLRRFGSIEATYQVFFCSASRF